MPKSNSPQEMTHRQQKSALDSIPSRISLLKKFPSDLHFCAERLDARLDRNGSG